MAKVVLLHYAAPPVIGGVEQVLAHQAELFSRAGHSVVVIAGRGSSWESSIRVQVIPEIDSRHPQAIQYKMALDEGILPPGFEAFQAGILRALRTELAGADVLIAHNVASLHKNLALTAALRQFAESPAGTRVFLWHHDFAWNSRRYQQEMHPGFPWDLLKTDWPGVRQVTISEARRQEMSQIYGIPVRAIQVVANGIDPADFQKITSGTRRLVEQFGLNQAFPLLLTPVRLTSRKNLEFGLRILAELVRHMPEARWVVTGPAGAHNPDNLAYFQQLVALRREMRLENQAILMAEYRPDGLSSEQIGDFYRISDALLLTSQEEGFGLPVIEAGLTRLPVFATDLAPLRALGSKWAAYFTLDDPPADIAAQIAARLAADPAYRLRERIRRNFTWEAIYRQEIAPLIFEQNEAKVR